MDDNIAKPPRHGRHAGWFPKLDVDPFQSGVGLPENIEVTNSMVIQSPDKLTLPEIKKSSKNTKAMKRMQTRKLDNKKEKERPKSPDKLKTNFFTIEED